MIRMMDNRLPHPVLAAYEALSLLTDRMLEAARAQDWDQLVELEKECRRLAEALQTASDAALTLEEQRRKAAIIRKVLADDAQIRSLAVEWMAELERLLGANRREQALRRAYGEAGGR
ncbi:MAG: flagellar protein FliT [Azospira oryzae]|nr:MAG: flagellar protein FliT [Azospira oryzae]PZP77581.1 MAG: flagellar protein FliT [Azospira oryzae]